MISGSHVVLYSKDPQADRAFLKDILNLPHVDVGEGWLIFGLPPSELAVHPSGENDKHEFYLLCENISQLREKMADEGIQCSEVSDEGWGLLCQLSLPGGGKLGVYEPRHARPEDN